MTNAEINKAYIAHLGMGLEKGNINNLSPLMHYFLMDCAYQVYCTELQNLPLRQLAAKHRNKIKRGFHDFFKSTHYAFSPDQLDYLLEKVDEFQKYIHNYVELCKVAVLDCISQGTFNERLLISNIWLVNMLSLDAADYMAEVYRNSERKSWRDRNIDAVLSGSKDLGAVTMRDTSRAVDDKKFETLRQHVSNLAKKICLWVVDDFRNNNAETKCTQ